MGHKRFTACGCGVENKTSRSSLLYGAIALRTFEAGNASFIGVKRIVMGFITHMQILYGCMGGNLNAYNVSKQQGIVKPDEYSAFQFCSGVIDQALE